MQELECYFGQEEVYEQGSEMLEKVLRISVNKKQIERVSKHYGEGIEKYLEKESLEHLPQKVDESEQIYAMIDGSMIYTRLGEWKETKLGRIFSSKNYLDIGKNRHWIRDSLYVGHVGKCEDFFEKLAPYTDTYDHQLAFIGDGAPWIWNWVESHYPQSTQILDYYHAIEHLGMFASLIFGQKEEKERWIEKQEGLLWEDKCERVIEEIQEIQCKNKQQKDKQDQLIHYYQSNMDRMQYKTFTEKGLLIGSGAIESAHRTVIQKRLKLSGQRWTIQGAQQVLNLRVANMSGYWDKVIDLIDRRIAA